MNRRLASLVALVALASTTLTSADYDPNIASMVSAVMHTDVNGYLNHLTNGIGIRETGSANCNQVARDYIVQELEDLVYFDSVTTKEWTAIDFRGEMRTGYNVIAEKTGTGTSPRTYIFIAHYDTQRDTVPPGGTVGADDNGSGTAALLAVAKAFAGQSLTFDDTIRFVAVSGEEDGELGSEDYAAEAYATDAKIAAVINVDMAGHYNEPGDPLGSHPDLVKVYENCKSMWLTDFADQVALDYAGEIQGSYGSGLMIDRQFDGPGSGQPHPASDQQPFWNRLYDGIWFHEYDTNWVDYHTPNDTIANMKVDYATKVARLAAATVAELADHREWGRRIESPISGSITLNDVTYSLGGTAVETTREGEYDTYDLSGSVDFNDAARQSGIDQSLWRLLPVVLHITGYFEPWFCLEPLESGTTTMTFSGSGYTGQLVDNWSVVDRFTYQHTFSGTLSGPEVGLPRSLPYRLIDKTLTWGSDQTAQGTATIPEDLTVPPLPQIDVQYSISYTGLPAVPVPLTLEGETNIESVNWTTGEYSGTAVVQTPICFAMIPSILAVNPPAATVGAPVAISVDYPASHPECLEQVTFDDVQSPNAVWAGTTQTAFATVPSVAAGSAPVVVDFHVGGASDPHPFTVIGGNCHETPYTVVEEGNQSSHPTASTPEGGVLLIKSQGEWNTFYDDHHPGGTPPGVDFAGGERVIVAFAGQRNTGGYTIDVVDYVALGGVLLDVTTCECFPEPYPDCAVTVAITRPYQFVKVGGTLSATGIGWNKLSSGCGCGGRITDSGLGAALTLARASGEDITLSWGPSCFNSDNDYEVYEGSLGIWYSHAPVVCSTAGATSETISPQAGDWYYLVVPRNIEQEGSYGADSEGQERPQEPGACIPQLIGDCPP